VVPSPRYIPVALTRFELPLLLVGGLGYLVFLVWIPLDGGFEPVRWLPGGLFYLALLIVVAVSRGISFGPGRLVTVAVAALALFAVWNGASILWADVRSDAWNGANRTFVYLLIFAVFAALPWTPTVTRLLQGGFVLAVAAIVMSYLARATSSGAAQEWLIGGRLAVPLDYANANAALCLSLLLPAALFASRREVPPLLRGLFLASGGVFAEAYLLCQSRAALLVLPVVTLLVVLLAPGRVRLVLALVPVALAAVVTAPVLFDVYAADLNTGDLTAALRATRAPIAVAVLALFCVGTVWGVVDRRVEIAPRVTRATGFGAIATVVVGIASAAIVLLAVYGDPVGHARSAWHQFKANERIEGSNTNLFSGVGSKRYDVWRIALLEFRDAPVLGIGSENFEVPYLQRRRTEQDVRFPHSLPIKALVQTGVVGAALLIAFLAAGLFAGVRATRRLSGWSRVASVAALASFFYWLGHGSFDWFWEYPALTGPALAALALAARTTADPEPPPARPSGRRAVVLGAVLACVTVAALASFVPPWLSARYLEQAVTLPPAAALDRLDRARSLNPLTDQPDVLGGIIAGRSGDDRRARQLYLRALSRNRTNWFAELELAILEGNHARWASATAHIRRANELNPRETLIDFVLRHIQRRQPTDRADVERAFLERSKTFRRGEAGQQAG
jgi:O-antigen ligase/polysaccharide polymerase Wzy-like membrane protein